MIAAAPSPVLAPAAAAVPDEDYLAALAPTAAQLYAPLIAAAAGQPRPLAPAVPAPGAVSANAPSARIAPPRMTAAPDRAGTSMPAPPVASPVAPAPKPATLTPRATAGALPAIPAAPRPPSPEEEAAQNAVDARQAEYNRLEKTGSGLSQWHPTSLLGKIGKGFAEAGNIAGTVFMPSAMAAIPGTSLHHMMLENRAARSLAGAYGNEKAQSAADESAARAALDQAQATALGEKPPLTPEQQAIDDYMQRHPGTSVDQAVQAYSEANRPSPQEQFLADYRAEHPGATPEDAETAWTRANQRAVGGKWFTLPNGHMAYFSSDQQPPQGARLASATLPNPQTSAFYSLIAKGEDPMKAYQELMAAANAGKAMGASGAYARVRAATDLLSYAQALAPAMLPYAVQQVELAMAQLSAAEANTGAPPAAAPAAPPDHLIAPPRPQIPKGMPVDTAGNPVGLRSPEAPTAQTRTRAQFAAAVLPTIARAQAEISRIISNPQNRHVLGPLQGRWAEFNAGHIGGDQPVAIALRTDLHNIATAWMRLHANSDAARQEFEAALRLAQTPQDLEAALKSIQEQATVYAQQQQGYREEGLPPGAREPGRVAAAKAPKRGVPRPGTIEGGYKFMGGDPSKRTSWKKVGG